MRKNKPLTIHIGKDGIGEELHPSMQKSKHEQTIHDIVVLKEKKENTKEKKLYLNKIINLLNNKRRRKPLRHKFLQRFLKIWRKEKLNDLKDLCLFIFIHGCLGASVLLTFLTITSVNIELVYLIRYNKWLTVLIYIMGLGSAYYLLIDLNMVLKETWGRKK